MSADDPDEYGRARQAAGSPDGEPSWVPSLRAAATRDARDRLSFLDGKRFTARQLCDAAQISQDTLTNYTRKQGLVLFSESPGQGRARAHALADVYVAAVIGRLADLTGKTKQVIDVVWDVFCHGEVVRRAQERKGNDEAVSPDEYADAFAEVADAVCTSVWNAAGWLGYRETENPYLLFLIPSEQHRHGYAWFMEPANGTSWLLNHDAAVFVNLTALFSAVDLRLVQSIQRGGL